MLRIVLDANIYVSALLKPEGPQAKLLRLGLRRKYRILLSQSIFFELAEVFQYKKIIKKISLSKNEIKEFLEQLTHAGTWIKGDIHVTACEDPDDNIYLACAKEAQADFLVSGDQHLLKMKAFGETKIVTTRSFLEFLKQPE